MRFCKGVLVGMRCMAYIATVTPFEFQACDADFARGTAAKGGTPLALAHTLRLDGWSNDLLRGRGRARGMKVSDSLEVSMIVFELFLWEQK